MLVSSGNRRIKEVEDIDVFRYLSNDANLRILVEHDVFVTSLANQIVGPYALSGQYTRTSHGIPNWEYIVDCCIRRMSQLTKSLEFGDVASEFVSLAFMYTYSVLRPEEHKI